MWSKDLPQYTQHIRISWSYFKMQSPLFLSGTLNLNTYFSCGNGSQPLFSFHHGPKIRVGMITNHRFEEKEWTKDRSWAEVWRWLNRIQTWGVGEELQDKQIREARGFPAGSVGKECTCIAEDTWELGLIPGSERCPGEGQRNPLQYSCLENLMDRGDWWSIVHRVAKSRTRLSDWAGVHKGEKRSRNRLRKENKERGPSLAGFQGAELSCQTRSTLLCWPKPEYESGF